MGSQAGRRPWMSFGNNRARNSGTGLSLPPASPYRGARSSSAWAEPRSPRATPGPTNPPPPSTPHSRQQPTRRQRQPLVAHSTPARPRSGATGSTTVTTKETKRQKVKFASPRNVYEAPRKPGRVSRWFGLDQEAQGPRDTEPAEMDGGGLEPVSQVVWGAAVAAASTLGRTLVRVLAHTFPQERFMLPLGLSAPERLVVALADP